MPSRYSDITSRRHRAVDHGTERSEFMDAVQIIGRNYAQKKVRGTNRTQCGRCGGYYTEAEKQLHETCQIRPSVPLVKRSDQPIGRSRINPKQKTATKSDGRHNKKSKTPKKRPNNELLPSILSPHEKEHYLKEHFIKRYSIESVEILGEEVFLGLFDQTVSVNPAGLESLARNIASDYSRLFRRDRVTWTLRTSDGSSATATLNTK